MISPIRIFMFTMWMFRSTNYLKGSGAFQMGQTIPPYIISKNQPQSQDLQADNYKFFSLVIIKVSSASLSKPEVSMRQIFMMKLRSRRTILLLHFCSNELPLSCAVKLTLKI
ncbi:hypothetical protein D3830_07635 [Streptococcus mutans]|nr:hypothetical protein [Streptococcus mutans]NLQ77141.1 hypothetical protein [Streptococcus mutans]